MSIKDKWNALFETDDEMETTSYDTEEYNTYEQPYQEEEMKTTSKMGKDNVVNIKANKNDNAQAIEVYYPRVFSEAERIGQVLLDGRAVVLNFERMKDDDIRRFIDYLAGLVYAIEGDMQRVSTDVFIATTKGFVISGEREELQMTNRTSTWDRKED